MCTYNFQKTDDPFVLKLANECHGSHFIVGEIVIVPKVREQVPEYEIKEILTRHCRLDFGDVSFEWHQGNREAIAEGRGSFTSVYSTKSGKKVYIMTKLDDFEPKTTIMFP